MSTPRLAFPPETFELTEAARLDKNDEWTSISVCFAALEIQLDRDEELVVNTPVRVEIAIRPVAAEELAARRPKVSVYQKIAAEPVERYLNEASLFSSDRLLRDRPRKRS